MKYTKENIKKVRSLVNQDEFITKCRMKITDFTRQRKMGALDVVYYLMNKKGLSNKMEIIKFEHIKNLNEISSVAVLKQREKLNPEAFVYLKNESLKLFYEHHQNEVKTYKGYIITATDGSDLEIPNSPTTRQIYNGKQESCARLTVSINYDLLNKYALDCIIEKYDYSEPEMAKRHLSNIPDITGEYKVINIMDRGYPSLENIYFSVTNEQKFIVRLSSKDYKKERSKMTSNDEEIKIGYEYSRARFYKDRNQGLYDYLNSGKTINVRIINVVLESGEIETLLTNLDFTYDEVKELYNLRWRIETNYHYLKESLKIEIISSSKPRLIEQDIHSQILVFNMLQSYINENNDKIEKDKYKNTMKTNVNMAIGIFKDAFILALIEEDNKKRDKMLDEILKKISRYIVPVKKVQKVQRKGNVKNKYHINKRKTF